MKPRCHLDKSYLSVLNVNHFGLGHQSQNLRDSVSIEVVVIFFENCPHFSNHNPEQSLKSDYLFKYIETYLFC